MLLRAFVLMIAAYAAKEIPTICSTVDRGAGRLRSAGRPLRDPVGDDQGALHQFLPLRQLGNPQGTIAPGRRLSHRGGMPQSRPERPSDRRPPPPRLHPHHQPHLQRDHQKLLPVAPTVRHHPATFTPTYRKKETSCSFTVVSEPPIALLPAHMGEGHFERTAVRGVPDEPLVECPSPRGEDAAVAATDEGALQ